MKNYNIEGNIDFFSELYKSLDIEENQQKTAEDDNLCLISCQPLTTNFVKMICGHKFNYIPLYNDIKNHKQKFNSLEGNNSQLKYDEIRCPYCRNKQTELLPYYEGLGLDKVHGVNFIDVNRKTGQPYSSHNYTKCDYLSPNPNYDPSGNNPIKKGTIYSNQNCEFFTCSYHGFYQINQFIEGYIGEDLCLCYSHKKKMVKDHNNNLKLKAKEEAKKVKEEAKKEEKEQAKKVKEEAKKAAKEEAKKGSTKVKKPKIIKENIILGPSVITNEPVDNKCIEILKSGSKKGTQCGCKVFDTTYCKRHTKQI